MFGVLATFTVSRANSVGMSITTPSNAYCAASGWSYATGSPPAQGGTYLTSGWGNAYGGSNCTRYHIFKWFNQQAQTWWQDSSWTSCVCDLSRSDYGSTASAGEHLLSNGPNNAGPVSTNSAW